jgi:hypothetical protein
MVAVAGALVGLYPRRDLGQPWPWLAAFAVAQGVSLWLASWAATWRSGALAWSQLVVTLASWVALVEFGRRGLGARRHPRIGWWIHPILMAATILAACLAGWDAVDRAGRIAIGLPGILLAAPVLWHLARSGRGDRPAAWIGRRLAASTLFLLMLVGWATVPRFGLDVAAERAIVAGATATAPNDSVADGDLGSAVAVAPGTPAWENITSRRLRWGIPLLLAVGACAAVALAACHHASRRL